ncbi:MAG: thioesterase family protein [Burkholderiaceae bacterium]
MFTTRKQIRFHHCDPAGIVFYPQYFYLLSEAMEDFMAAAGKPQHEQINVLRRGWPIIKLDVDFVRMSRYGDEVAIDVLVRRIGGASLSLDYVIRGLDGDRLKARTTVVHVDLDTDRAIPIPDDVRAAFEPYLVES